jgi:hypothetical protein
MTLVQQIIEDNKKAKAEHKALMKFVRSQAKPFKLSSAPTQYEYQMSSSEIDRHIMESARP